MYHTLEAEIHPDGSVTLCEPIHPKTRCRAMVTILQPLDKESSTGDSRHWIDQLWEHRLPISEPIIPLGRDEAHQR